MGEIEDVLFSIIGPDSKDILWWQMGIRGILIFVLALLMVRYGDKRIFGKSAAFDIVLGIILGSILSRAITGNSPFLQTTFTAMLLVALHWLLSVLSFHFRWFGKMVKGEETLLVKDGQWQKDCMENCRISEHDILEACRQNGKVEKLEQVKAAYFERSGNISVIPAESK